MVSDKLCTLIVDERGYKAGSRPEQSGFLGPSKRLCSGQKTVSLRPEEGGAKGLETYFVAPFVNY